MLQSRLSPFCGFAPPTERKNGDQCFGHAKTRKYPEAGLWSMAKWKHITAETTPTLRRALSLPDCHEELTQTPTRKKPAKSVAALNRGGNGTVKRTRSVSFPPEVLLFAAVANNDVQELQRILQENEINLNHQSPSGLSALHCAAAEGSFECLQELVSRGVVLDVIDSQGCSPLDFAVRGGYFDCAAYLIEAGADIENIVNGFR